MVFERALFLRLVHDGFRSVNALSLFRSTERIIPTALPDLLKLAVGVSLEVNSVVNKISAKFNETCTGPTANRMALIQPFHVMEVMERARQLEATGRRIIHMEIGQPDFGAPPQVIAAAMAAMRDRTLGYTSTLGIDELRIAIAEFYQSKCTIKVSPERIAITMGASGAFVLALGVLINPGDEVLMPDPCYSCNPNFVRFFDAIPVTMPVDEKDLYQPRLETVQRHWSRHTRGILLASPSNPTGTTIPELDLRTIADWVHAQGGFVIVDEIYQGLNYGEPSRSALEPAPGSWIINSFSKYFGMTGWRIGWMVIPEGRVRDIEKLAQNAFICPSAPAQYAALGAFGPDALAVLEARRLEFLRRRNFLVPALRKLGFRVPTTPTGAFYVYAGCSKFGDDSSALAAHVLEDAGVAITPGVDFGTHLAKQHVRFAYTRSMKELQEGVSRLRRLLVS